MTIKYQIPHLLLLVLLLGFSAELLAQNKAGVSHNPPQVSGVCADTSLPANLLCASTVSSVFDKQGRLWLVWAKGGHVYIQHSDDKGKNFSAPVAVNRTPEQVAARGENRPKIVIDKNSNIYVSWTMPLTERFSGHVRFSVSTDGGKSFAEPKIVNDNLDITGHRFEALGVNNRGDIYLAWLDKRDRFAAAKKSAKYTGAAVYFSWSEDGGKTFKQNKKIIDHSCECCRVIMDFDKNDLPVILWRNIYDTNIRDHALVRFVSRDTPGQIERVSFDNWAVDACPHHGPAMAVNDQGDFHMTWFNNAEKRHGLFYARRNASTDKLTQAVQFGDYANGASHADVMFYQNTVWLVWKQFDGQQESIWLQKSVDNGNNWQQTEQLAVTDKSSDYPFLIKDRDRVYLQWQTEAEGYRLISIN